MGVMGDRVAALEKRVEQLEKALAELKPTPARASAPVADKK